MFRFFLIFLRLLSLNFLFAYPVYATTAVDDVSVNHLTSFHVHGPEGWPNTYAPYAPPYYNDERDELIGVTTGYNRAIYGLKPSESHYYKITEDITSFLPVVKHPNADELYMVTYYQGRREGTQIFYIKSKILKVDMDGSNPQWLIEDESESAVLDGAISNPVFDNQGRLYVAEASYSGNANLYQLSLDNQLTLLHSFEQGAQGQISQPNGIHYSQDGWIYGLLAYKRGTPYFNTLSSDPDFPVGILYKIHPDQENSFQILHTFLLKHGELPAEFSPLDENRILAYLIEDTNGYLYGGTTVGSCNTARGELSEPVGTGDNGFLCGAEYTLHYSRSPYDLAIRTPSPHYDGPNPYGSLYRIKKDGSDFTILHTFSGEDGSQPRGPMAITPDNVLYGTTMGGGVHKAEYSLFPAIVGNPYPLDDRNESPNGTIYRIKLDDIQIENGEVTNSGFEHVHSFRAGINENQDGKVPTGIMYASNGKLYGTTRYGGRPYTEGSGRSYQFDNKGTVFEVDLDANTPGGSIVVTATPGNIGPGETAEITWSGAGISNCLASGGSDQDDWQQDEEREVMGSIKVTPDPGTYYYTINCADDLKGGRVGSLATLYADAEARISSGESLEYGNGTGALNVYFLLILLSVSGLGYLQGRRKL